jgi:hypothetical protein
MDGTSVLFGASREEAPEEVVASCATRLLGFLGISVSEAGRKSGYPKKGRRTPGGFGPGLGSQDFGSEDQV